MKLQEYQAREICNKYQIPVPAGGLCATPEEAEETAKSIGKEVMIKAQVTVAGRGKAGGIKKAATPTLAKELAEKILFSKIKDVVVKKVLVVEALNIKEEYYLSLAVDRDTRKIVLIASSVGGVDIEEIAKSSPEKISKIYLDDLSRIYDFQARKICFAAQFNKKYIKDITKIITSLHKILIDRDALLVEINPLVITSEEKVYAADAKIIVDDNAMFRQPYFWELFEDEDEHPLEKEAKKRKLPYVKLSGNIGIIGNGAGLVMTTMDLVEQFGGMPANFLDFGAGAKSEVIRSAVELVLKDKNVKGILINIFGGLTRGDEVAKGIIEVFRTMEVKVPIVIRLAGNRKDEGIAMLESANLNLVAASSIINAAKKIVEITR